MEHNNANNIEESSGPHNLVKKWEKTIKVIKNCNVWKNSINTVHSVNNENTHIKNTNENINIDNSIITRNRLLRCLVLSLGKANDEVYRLNGRVYQLCWENSALQDKLQEQQKWIEDNLTETTQCCICMTQPKNHVYINCGHLCICGNCAQKWKNECPMCRREGLYIKVI